MNLIFKLSCQKKTEKESLLEFGPWTHSESKDVMLFSDELTGITNCLPATGVDTD